MAFVIHETGVYKVEIDSGKAQSEARQPPEEVEIDSGPAQNEAKLAPAEVEVVSIQNGERSGDSRAGSSQSQVRPTFGKMEIDSGQGQDEAKPSRISNPWKFLFFISLVLIFIVFLPITIWSSTKTSTNIILFVASLLCLRFKKWHWFTI